jgi:hypothetical protein
MFGDGFGDRNGVFFFRKTEEVKDLSRLSEFGIPVSCSPNALPTASIN